MNNSTHDMNLFKSRREMMKTSGMIFGGLFLGIASSPIYAKTFNFDTHNIFRPTPKNPLLLNSNENSLGISQKANEEIIKYLPKVFRYLTYNDDSARVKLIEKIAQIQSLKKENIILGNGSSEIIQAIIQALIFKAKYNNKAVQLVVPELTFEFAKLYALSLKIPIANIPLASDMSFDISKMQNNVEIFKGISIVYLCNPNNPTGKITAAKDLDKWINKSSEDTYFIFDEAYEEYVDDENFESSVRYIKSGSKNIILTKTFSKLYALAGLRVGYGLSNANLIKEIEAFIELDNINLLGGVAALASLNDENFAKESKKANDISKKILQDTLDELKINYLSSQANFIFYKVKNGVKPFIKKMAEHNIIVGREFLPYSEWSRVSLGTPHEISAFCLTLKDFRTKGWI